MQRLGLCTEHLLRNFTPEYVSRSGIEELQTEGPRALSKTADEPGTMSLVVVFCGSLEAEQFVREGAVEEDRQLARGRGDGFGLADSYGQTAIEAPSA